MDDAGAKRDWVSRVLGVAFAEGAGAKGSGAEGAGAEGAGAGLEGLLPEWRDARARVRAEMDGFRRAVLGQDGVADDPRLPFVKAALAELPRMLPKSMGGLDRVLGKAGGDAAGVLKAVAAVRAELGGGGLGRVEQFAARQLGGGLDVRSVLSGALDAIERGVGRGG